MEDGLCVVPPQFSAIQKEFLWTLHLARRLSSLERTSLSSSPPLQQCDLAGPVRFSPAFFHQMQQVWFVTSQSYSGFYSSVHLNLCSFMFLHSSYELSSDLSFFFSTIPCKEVQPLTTALPVSELIRRQLDIEMLHIF